MTENFGYCYELVFSPDGGTLVTIEAVLSNPHPRFAVGACRRNETGSLLARRFRGRAQGPPLCRNPGESLRWRHIPTLGLDRRDGRGRLTLAVRAETGEVWLYTTKGGYCKAVCRLLGSEVVVIPRTDLAVPYTQTVVDEIGRVAIAVTGARSCLSDPSQWPSRVGAVLARWPNRCRPGTLPWPPRWQPPPHRRRHRSRKR